ncbi:MAG: hypothetical protein E7K72_00745 [Roseomonas mucosa]|nr:hypothetical protein [Roseomonas mucosa]
MTSTSGTPSRPVRRVALLATLAVAALPAAAADTGVSCPLVGAVYAAGPHRLTMELLPEGALGSAVYTLWRFRARGPGGAALSELRMLYVCPNGRANCSISPSARPGPRGGYFSEAIGLNRDLSLTTGEDTPYAFVLPGFATIRWEGAARDLAADITYATRARTAPDFDNRVVWRRLRCGPPEAGR